MAMLPTSGSAANTRRGDGVRNFSGGGRRCDGDDGGGGGGDGQGAVTGTVIARGR